MGTAELVAPPGGPRSQLITRYFQQFEGFWKKLINYLKSVLHLKVVQI